jgi:hypothetical protein
LRPYRQIIFLFFYRQSSIVNRQSSIVNRQSSTHRQSSSNRQGIVKVSSIVNIVNRQYRQYRQSSISSIVKVGMVPAVQVKRSKGPKVKPGPTVGTTTGAGAKGIYISHATAPQKNK